jgi:hypothetical protein
VDSLPYRTQKTALKKIFYLNVGVLAVHDPDGLAPELDLVQMVDGVDGLLRLSHLDQGRVLLVEQDLHSLHRRSSLNQCSGDPRIRIR